MKSSRYSRARNETSCTEVQCPASELPLPMTHMPPVQAAVGVTQAMAGQPMSPLQSIMARAVAAREL